MEQLIATLSAIIYGHVEDRSASWWTGPNSLWGKLTGASSGSSHTYYPGPSEEINPLYYLAIAYLIFGK